MEKVRLIAEFGDVRIVDHDSYNLRIERLEDGFNMETNRTEFEWQFKAYSRSILAALNFIQSKGLMADKNAISSLETCLNRVLDSKHRLVGLISSL